MPGTASSEFFCYTPQENSDVHLQLNLKWISMPDTASNEFACYSQQENSDVYLQLKLKVDSYVRHCFK